MRNRDAWLAAIAATLGISEEACRRDATPQVQQVAIATPSASTSVVAEPQPSATATEIATPSATASVATKTAPPLATTTVDMSAVCGAVPQNMVNAACGASPQQNTVRGPSAVVAVSLSGGASGDDHVAAILRPRLRACANQALAQDPSQQGKLLVSVTIGASGDVNKADITTNQGLSAASAQCMQRMVKNVKFPTGAVRTVTLVIVQTKQSP